MASRNFGRRGGETPGFWNSKWRIHPKDGCASTTISLEMQMNQYSNQPIEEDIQRILGDSQRVNELTYERAMQNLNGVCDILSNTENRVELETSLQLYLAGNKFATRCRTKLDEFRKNLETVNGENGQQG